MKRDRRLLILLHIFLMVYSTGGIVSKLAAREQFMSLRFLSLYAVEILILGVYAIGWQQFIRRMPLSVAYANKAVTVIWGCIWGVLVFHEQLTVGKVVGGLMVLCGVALYGIADGEANEAAVRTAALSGSEDEGCAGTKEAGMKMQTEDGVPGGTEADV